MTLIEYYEQAKLALGAWVGENDRVLHIHVGLAIYVAVRLAGGFRRSPLWALLAVVVLEVANEVVDHAAFHSWRRVDTTHDLVDTLLWPALLTVARLANGRRR